MKGTAVMFFSRKLSREERMLERELGPLRRKLARAGLKEKVLRNMDPDERVTVLEGASLDPYEFLYLAWG